MDKNTNNDKNSRLGLALETALNENKLLKSELIQAKKLNNELETKVKKSEETSERSQTLLKKSNSQIENWKYKYKCLQQKIIEIETIQTQIQDSVKNLLDENGKLRHLVEHGDCVHEALRIENNNLKKEWEIKFSDLSLQNDKLLIENQNLIERVTELDIEVKNLAQCELVLKVENEKIVSERHEVEMRWLKSHQTISEYEKSIKNLENILNEKDLQLKSYETERGLVNQELNSHKISSEIEINELKQQIKKFDLRLKSEIDEKMNLKTILEDRDEQIYLAQLNNKELVESLKRYQAKKTYDNFTQTIFMFNTLNLNHRSTQTDKQTPAYLRTAFTQTPVVLTRNFNTQTGGVLLKTCGVQTDRILEKQTPDGRELNKNLSYKSDGWDFNLIGKGLNESDEENYAPKKTFKSSDAKSLFDNFSKSNKKVRFSKFEYHQKD